MRSGFNATLYNMTYWYDNAGNVQSMGDRSPSFNGLQTYQYDSLNRLTHAYSGGTEANPYDETYAYDALGDLSSRTGVGSYTYGDSAHKHAVTAAGSYTYTYDLNGNMATRFEQGKTWTQAWDADNRVLSMTSGLAAVQFVYDGNGQRVKRIENSITTTVYVGALYELNVQTGVTTTYYFAGGKRIAVRTGGVLSYLYGDHLGSTSFATNSSGGLKSFVRYKPFGLTRDFTALLPTDFGYTSQRFEAKTGYIYDYRCDCSSSGRFYDQFVGRFLSSDTDVPGSQDPQSLNRYAYTQNNPLRYVDPSGHECQQPDGSACTQETVSDQQGLSAAQIIKRDDYVVDDYGWWVPTGEGASTPDRGQQSYFDQRAISWNGEMGTFSNGRKYDPQGGELNQWQWGKAFAQTGKRDLNEIVVTAIAEAGPGVLFADVGAVGQAKSDELIITQ